MQFAERLSHRRAELRLSREELRDRAGPDGEGVSISTLKNMENTVNRYGLPRKKPTSYRPAVLELVASALDVPLGYLLRGFSDSEIAKSHYGVAVSSGHIELVDVLRPNNLRAEKLKMFIHKLPTDEDEIFDLPLYSFQNERALAVIFAIERIYCGLEMLIVNEPPFVLWDDQDIEGWSSSIGLSVEDNTAFLAEFRSYKAFFRNLIETGQKTYKVVVNYPTLKRFLARKPTASRAAWLEDAIRLLRFQNFNFVIHRPVRPFGDYAADDGVHECEVLCKTQEIPVTLEGMVACQILQTPPHVKPTSYIISPAPRDVVMVQREVTRVDTAWAEALSQYQADLDVAPDAPGPELDTVRNHTVELLRSL
jgi:transcriptional regulator with XRE-family HTH domain